MQTPFSPDYARKGHEIPTYLVTIFQRTYWLKITGLKRKQVSAWFGLMEQIFNDLSRFEMAFKTLWLWVRGEAGSSGNYIRASSQREACFQRGYNRSDLNSSNPLRRPRHVLGDLNDAITSANADEVTPFQSHTTLTPRRGRCQRRPVPPIPSRTMTSWKISLWQRLKRRFVPKWYPCAAQI